MTKFAEWCSHTTVEVSGHEFNVLVGDVKKGPHAVKLLANAVPDFYAAPKRIAHILRNLGHDAVAKHIEAKLPTTAAIRSGDLGEILGLAYLGEFSSFDHAVKRLRWKDHRNMAMRGEDVLAFSSDNTGSKLRIVKGEVKSRVTMSTPVIDAARTSLSSNKGLPSPHALAFLSDRLFEAGQTELSDLLDAAQLKRGIAAGQVKHMLFTFSGNDATKLLQKNLTAYTGGFPQMYVALRVVNHKEFIQSVFEAVGK